MARLVRPELVVQLAPTSGVLIVTGGVVWILLGGFLSYKAFSA